MKPEQRFSNRVADYIRYRPGYPPEVPGLLQLRPGMTIADVGSGTGISTELVLRAGCEVMAVEPNAEMRAAAENRLGHFPGFHSVDGTAEATTLADHSADMVVAAQAFHWFHPERTRAEFSRILKPGAPVVLIWNERRLDSTPFLRDYEKLLLRHGTDYAKIRHENINAETLAKFFIDGDCVTHVFENQQMFDLAGLEGRLLSCSYAPAAGQPGHDEMMADLRHLFVTNEKGNRVAFEYDTRVHIGR